MDAAIRKQIQEIMVVYDQQIFNRIDDFLNYVIGNDLCSVTRAKEKSWAILKRLQSLDGPFCTDKPSAHRSFGMRQGYLYGFSKIKRLIFWNLLS